MKKVVIVVIVAVVLGLPWTSPPGGRANKPKHSPMVGEPSVGSPLRRSR